MAYKITGFQKLIQYTAFRFGWFVMGIANRDIQSLIASRICHDLISPIGAIGNGLELLTQVSGTTSPELSLIDQSARHANAKLRYFRIAFGAARSDGMLSRDDLTRVVADMYGDSKLLVGLQTGTESLPRPIVKLALLLILCAEKALPFGGQLDVAMSGEAVSFRATSREVRAEPELFDALATGILPDALASDQVQFAVTAHTLAELNKRAMVEYTDTTLSIGVS